MDARSGRMHDRSPGDSVWRRVLPVRRGEWPALLWSVVFHFCILAGYYIIRPVRDEIGAEYHSQVQVTWTIVFVVTLGVIPLYAALASARRRRIFLPGLYAFFVVNIGIFYALLTRAGEDRPTWLEWTFYIWCSVFNLFAVTAFWGFMADAWRNDQSRRLFGIIAVGGSLGGVAGPAITHVLVKPIGRDGLLLIAAGLLATAACCAWGLDRLLRRSPASTATDDRPRETSTYATAKSTSPGSLAACVVRAIGAVFSSPYLLGIAAFLLIQSLGSTFLYFEKLELIGEAIVDRDQRTRFFARIDLYVNIATMLVQCLLLARIIRVMGVGRTLVIRPLITVVGFVILGASLLLAADSEASNGVRIVFFALVLFEVARRAGNYALAKPTREMLFTVIAPDQKYRSKAFIDTVMYRGSDMVNGWFFHGLRAAGVSLAAIAFTAVPFAAAGLGIGLWLGRRQDQLAVESEDRGTAGAVTSPASSTS
jgi:AAA family ATP:ADP antiporter